MLWHIFFNKFEKTRVRSRSETETYSSRPKPSTLGLGRENHRSTSKPNYETLETLESSTWKREFFEYTKIRMYAKKVK